MQLRPNSSVQGRGSRVQVATTPYPLRAVGGPSTCGPCSSSSLLCAPAAAAAAGRVHVPFVSGPLRNRKQLARAVSATEGGSETAAVLPPSNAFSSTLKGVPNCAMWEIDFCSRPLLDDRGKKVWELLVCDPERTFEYSQYFPNSKINSAELKTALSTLVSESGGQMPQKVRFFRGQMTTIITKALTDLGIKAVPSRRCFTVMSWLQERLETVYKADPRFSDKAQSLFMLDLGAPEPLPDALRGEQWAFVQLPLASVMKMLNKVEMCEMFGSTFDLGTVGSGDLPKDILIPGVAVFSRRALPLAAWTNGLEIAAVKADVDRSCLILETGISQRWRYGGWKATPESIEEAQGWEEAKGEVNGLHFLAVQPDPDSEELNGLWLLQDRDPPSI